MIVESMFVYGDKKIQFTLNSMYMEPSDSCHDLTLFEDRLKTYAVYKILIKKGTGTKTQFKYKWSLNVEYK